MTPHPFEGDDLHPAIIAADHTLAALGPESGHLLVVALTAGWLRPDEAEQLRPLALAIGYIAGVEVPEHRAR